MSGARDRTVFIAVPTYGGIEPGFVESLIRLTHALAAEGVEHSFSFLSGESLITRARNRLVQQFLTRKCTHLLFLDADLVFDPKTILRLLSSGLPLVAAPYPFKRMPSALVVNLKTEDNGDGTGNVEVRSGFARAHEAATGCMLIAREVFEALAPHAPEYRDDLVGSSGETVRAFFDTGIETLDDGTRRFLSEDWHFTRAYQAVGGEVWVDTEAKIKHVGKHAYEAPSLEEEWAKPAV